MGVGVGVRALFSWDNCLDLKIMEFGSKDDLEDDDILPDTNIDRERTTTGRWAIFVFIVSATFMTVAMVSPNWIEADPRFYGTKVQRVGLWVHCFSAFLTIMTLNTNGSMLDADGFSIHLPLATIKFAIS